jgi:hypothetical protein
MERIIVRCWSCPRTFVTLNEMSTHHLDAHARPLPATAGQTIWAPRARATRFVPTLRGSNGVQVHAAREEK